jgi:hypothetical protein
VTLEPAVVVPPGSVGVVTRLTGDIGRCRWHAQRDPREDDWPGDAAEQIRRDDKAPSRWSSDQRSAAS